MSWLQQFSWSTCCLFHMVMMGCSVAADSIVWSRLSQISLDLCIIYAASTDAFWFRLAFHNKPCFLSLRYEPQVFCWHLLLWTSCWWAVIAIVTESCKFENSYRKDWVLKVFCKEPDNMLPLRTGLFHGTWTLWQHLVPRSTWSQKALWSDSPTCPQWRWRAARYDVDMMEE